MTKFRIYYSDSTYQGEPELAPALDVLVIVQANEKVGWAMVHSVDYYIYKKGCWYGVDIFGLFSYFAKPGWKRVLMGVKVTDEEYQKVYKRAKADCSFGRKQGFLPDERKVNAKSCI